MAQHSESGRAEQIISQLYLKALHAVLAARVPALQHALGSCARTLDAVRAPNHDRWFNLALGDLPAALNHPSFLLHGGGIMDPLFIDILLCPLDPTTTASIETTIERWRVQCEPPPPPSPWSAGTPQSSPGRSRDPTSVSTLNRRTYKKSIVLLRSLYCILRLLPAYHVLRMLAASHQSYSYDISYKISSFAAPFSRKEEEDFKLYSFTPIETHFGQLVVTVNYRPNLSDFNLQVCSLLPPMIIEDYVGSLAADPMRAFPPSPADKGVHTTSFPARAAPPPASPSLARPHSWTSAPLAHHPLSMSPISGFGASPPDAHGHRILSQQTLGYRKTNIGFDKFWLSPPFSPSPTPCPPPHSSNPLQSRLCLETAPVSIPLPATGKNQSIHAPNLSDPTKSQLPPLSPISSTPDLLSQESPSEKRYLRIPEGLRVADLSWNLQLLKGLKDGKDDSGRFSGVLSSCGSPQFVSRSSSRLSMQDDLDDGDFSCPLAVDDVDTSDTSDSHARNVDGKDKPESARGSTSSHKSPDAAVGILINMLKTATSLRQDHSCSSQSSMAELNAKVGSSRFSVPPKVSDALEELQSYRKIKDNLLSWSRTQLPNK